MFVLSLLHSKDKKDKVVIQINYREQKKSRRGHRCLSVVCAVRCLVEVSATGRSLVQRSPTDCVVSLCVIS
jgi:hypothetical protein